MPDSRKVLWQCMQEKKGFVSRLGQDTHNNDDGTMNDCRGALCSCTFEISATVGAKGSRHCGSEAKAEAPIRHVGRRRRWQLKIE